MLTLFRVARRVSAPLVVVKSSDQFAVVQIVARSFTKEPPPLIAWDIQRGMAGVNPAGEEAFNSLGIDPMMSTNPGEMLGIAARLPERSIVFMYNAHRFIGNEVVSQGVWNLRELFKVDGRTLVLLCPDIDLPAELQADVYVIDDPLPTEEELERILLEQMDAAGLAKPKKETMQKAVDAISGLAAFPAEQAVAMSLSKDGINVEELWDRKRQAIEQAPGLSVQRSGDTFDTIGGIENAKTFGRAVLAGENAPRVVVFMDEIEKALSGADGDTSGVSQEMLGQMLTWMQEKQVTGMLLVGPPGAAKSAFAKALGNTAMIPTINFDLTAMKGSLVGESGRNLRNAHKVVDAVAQGRVLVVATCNSVATLPPELRRRFNFGTFFFDLPTAEERDSIWRIYLKKYGVDGRKRPTDESWTGAEIRMCCDLAWRLKCSLVDASKYIVPVALSAAESIERLRTGANGRFISASKPGVYAYKSTRSNQATAGGRRAIAMTEE